MVIKFFITTRLRRHFTVKHELLRRIERKYHELGIEIPFPHHTVYHRGVEASPHGLGHIE